MVEGLRSLISSTYLGLALGFGVSLNLDLVIYCVFALDLEAEFEAGFLALLELMFSLFFEAVGLDLEPLREALVATTFFFYYISLSYLS